jgi:hypothetical protein
MKTTAASSTVGTLIINVALLLAGVRLTGFAWQDLCLLLLPPMLSSAAAGFAFVVLNRMARFWSLTDPGSGARAC